MKEREIFITPFDKERLEELVGVAADFGEPHGRDLRYLRDLRKELARATLVSSEAIPADVVTMNSQVLLRDLSNSEELSLRLVFPKDADMESGAISILAPVGTAILGSRAGDVVEWPVPNGTGRFAIEKVIYQPEAAGDYHL